MVFVCFFVFVFWLIALALPTLVLYINRNVQFV